MLFTHSYCRMVSRYLERLVRSFVYLFQSMEDGGSGVLIGPFVVLPVGEVPPLEPDGVTDPYLLTGVNPAREPIK